MKNIKNDMKLLMENFNKFLEQDKIDEMNFNPTGMGQMNPALSFPDHILAGVYGMHLTRALDTRGNHPSVKGAETVHVVESGKEAEEAKSEYYEMIRNIFKNQGVEGIPQQIKDDVEAGKYDKPHPDYVEPPAPRMGRGEDREEFLSQARKEMRNQ